MNTNRQTNKFIRFLQNNAALLIIILCTLAIASIILVVALSNNNQVDQPVVGEPTDDDSDDVVDDEVLLPDDDTTTDIEPTMVQVYFVSPVSQYTVGMGYTDGEEVLFVFNATLNSWSSNYSVNLIAESGTEVCSMHDGTVIDVDDSYELGGTVSIDYGDNIIVTYASLSNIVVVEGQVVEQGQTIATVSTTANNEFLEGDHVHVAITVDGVNVDPMPYIEGTMYIEQVEE